MAGFGKAILIAMIAAVSLIILFNVAFFFPWYLTLVEKGFAISQFIATDNYLKQNYYQDIMTELGDYQLFRARLDDVQIEAWHDNGAGGTAIEPSYHTLEEYYNDDYPKPYVQMGHPVLVIVSASYPLQMELFGTPIHELLPTLSDIHVSFKMTTTTTKHYKDLPYEYLDEPGLEVYEEFFKDWD
jgi:hypothetical protein